MSERMKLNGRFSGVGFIPSTCCTLCNERMVMGFCSARPQLCRNKLNFGALLTLTLTHNFNIVQYLMK